MPQYTPISQLLAEPAHPLRVNPVNVDKESAMTDVFVGGLTGLFLIAALILAMTGRKRQDLNDRSERQRSSQRQDDRLSRH